MDDSSGTGLPASIEAAWGFRSRPRKGPKPELSLGRVVEAGVRVAASEGLAAVSMSRVAGELGASTMALYRYVAAKDELLALMVDAAAGRPPEPATPEEGWRAGLTRWASTYLALLRRNAWVLQVTITGPPATPNQIAWLESGLTSMRRTGLTEREKVSVVVLLGGVVRNWAGLSGEMSASNQASGSTPHEAISTYARALSMLADPRRFPSLRAVLDAGVWNEPENPDDEFDFSMARILDGIEALMRSRESEPV
jgi:AcrR family transcriptional regulator